MRRALRESAACQYVCANERSCMFFDASRPCSCVANAIGPAHPGFEGAVENYARMTTDQRNRGHACTQFSGSIYGCMYQGQRRKQASRSPPSASTHRLCTRRTGLMQAVRASRSTCEGSYCASLTQYVLNTRTHSRQIKMYNACSCTHVPLSRKVRDRQLQNHHILGQ